MNLTDFAVSIVSQARCTSRPLALAIDLKSPSGQLIASAYDPTQPSQLWFPVTMPFSFQLPAPMPITIEVYGTAFVNVLTGLALYTDGNSGSPALQVPLSEMGAGSVWSYGGNSSGFTALVTLGDKNLRINGSAPYTNGMPVTIGGWDAGKPYELWTFIHSNAPYPASFDRIAYEKLTYNIISAMGLCVSSNGTAGDQSQLTVQTADPQNASQQFYLPIIYGPTTGYPVGFAMLNRATGNVAHAKGLGDGSIVDQVDTVPLDGNSIWTQNRHELGKFVSIRPLGNVMQNLNIPGNGPYKPGQGLVTWNWSRGAGNEIWALSKVSSGVQVAGKELGFIAPASTTVSSQERTSL